MGDNKSLVKFLKKINPNNIDINSKPAVALFLITILLIVVVIVMIAINISYEPKKENYPLSVQGLYDGMEGRKNEALYSSSGEYRDAYKRGYRMYWETASQAFSD